MMREFVRWGSFVLVLFEPGSQLLALMTQVDAHTHLGRTGLHHPFGQSVF